MMKRNCLLSILSLLLAVGLLSGCLEKAATPTDTIPGSSQAEQKQEEMLVVSQVGEESSRQESTEETQSSKATASPVKKSEKESSQNTVSQKPKREETSSKVTSSKAPEGSSAPASSQNTSSTFVPTWFQDLTEEKAQEISKCVEKDNYEYTPGDYFGTYNGYDVVLISQIDGVETSDDKSINIAGFEFKLSDTEQLVAYKENVCILLLQAYTNGDISKQAMENIHYIYTHAFRYEFDDQVVVVGIRSKLTDHKKEFTPADFPTLAIKSIQHQSWYLNVEGEPGYILHLALSIKNRRNVLNVIKELEKMEGVIFAEPNNYIEID